MDAVCMHVCNSNESNLYLGLNVPVFMQVSVFIHALKHLLQIPLLCGEEPQETNAVELLEAVNYTTQIWKSKSQYNV